MWLILCGWLQVAAAQTPRVVSKIEIKHIGPQVVSDSLVRANIRVKEGEAFTRLQVDNDVRNLIATGYFHNIQVTETDTDKGLVVTYLVQGKPRITAISFRGNTRFSSEKLARKLSSKVGQPLDKRTLFVDAQEILKLYQKSGYQQTKVTPVDVVDERAGRGTVTFEIEESPKVKIEDVIFEGAQAFSQRKLRSTLKTRRHWFFSWLTGSGVLKDEQFAEDKEKLVEFYQEQGYIDFELREVNLEYPTPETLTIRLVISEGKQYKVGAVDVQGITVFKREELARALRVLHGWDGKKGKLGTNGLAMDVGDLFTPKGLGDDREAITDAYGARGYVDARVGVIKTPNTDTGKMDLVFQVEEGARSYVERVDIRGNYKTKDKVIRRELAIAPGESFDMVRVKISRNRLEGMNYFERTQATPEPTDIGNDRKNLVITVEEKNTGNLALGAGLRSLDGAVGFVELTQGNFDLFNPPYFTGGGQKFRLSLQVGTQRQDYVLTFLEPWFLDRKLTLETSLYHRQLQYLSSLYNEKQTGGRIFLRRALGTENLIGGLGYTLENIGITDVAFGAPSTIKEEAGNTLVSKVTGMLAYDTRNSPLLPNRGQRTELLADLAGGPFGGQADFYKLELRTGWYFPGLLRGHILEVVGRLGVAEQLYADGRVPLFDRYFLGGQLTLRGFDYPEVGPKQFGPTGDLEAIGGNTYWLGSVEYSIPIIERVRVALFYDAGMVYSDSYSFKAFEGTTPLGQKWTTGFLNSNWGIGLRLNLPIGPLRLDYALPLQTDPFNDNGGKFQFGVGYSRDF